MVTRSCLSAIYQLIKYDFLGLRLASVHQPYPFHGIAGFQRLRRACVLGEYRQESVKAGVQTLM